MSSTYQGTGKGRIPLLFETQQKIKVIGSVNPKGYTVSGETGLQTQVCLIPEPVLFPRHYMTFQDVSLSRSSYLSPKH